MIVDKDMLPIFVDLDGTLIYTDLLLEVCLTFLKQNPLNIFLLIGWLAKGKANLKHKLAERVDINAATLPYNQDFLGFLKEQREQGRKLYLATASHQKYADAIAEHLGIFDGVLATSATFNMKGENKLKHCLEVSPKFAYAGNETFDFCLFDKAEESFLVNPTAAALRLSKKRPVTRIFHNENNTFKTLLKAMRVHQWLKNMLIFVPVFVSSLYLDLAVWGDAIIGFFLFSLLASATYLLNDLLDIEADRVHPRKCLRPIPSGLLSIKQAVLLAMGLFVATLIGSLLFTNTAFQLSIMAYLALTLLYTFVLKTYVIADVISLASLFTIRIIAGAMIIDVVLSFWLLAFSMFTFFSLALVKRCAELKLLSKVNKDKASGRDYQVEDYYLMQSFGVTSAFISLLLVAFYVQVSMTNEEYSSPLLLWASLPAFAYWFLRMWLKTNRGEMHDDPIVFFN
ncbi:UbiA family prenyltransferase [Methylophaga muralis]|uniref:Decaprenyl-phosphate phosphoribosyltransferase n=1 Tax=Methylophaga muralis TaxID=291169 RepID=A0A1E3GMY7_9GAMM|nr:UbiA family prenyltransferase [Methylophaga muralis]ODN65409.1 Decaprenyl-phosphate phosphoribosyltransferase [Methylophaga muralis]